MRHGSEVGGERIRALRLLRRGLHASPELRRGAWLTLALALLAGGGRNRKSTRLNSSHT